MIDGEVFRFNHMRIYYNRSSCRFVGFDSIVIKPGVRLELFVPWSRVTEWQVEVPRTSEDDVREGKLVLCWVVNSDGIKMKNPLLIKGIADSIVDKYEDITGRLWKRAAPVAPDDPAIYKGEK